VDCLAAVRTNEVVQAAGTSGESGFGESPCTTASEHHIQNRARELEKDGTPLSSLNKPASIASKHSFDSLNFFYSF